MSIKTKESINTVKDLEKHLGKMTLGLFLRAFREADNCSQVSFSKKLKISRANLCDIEKGRKLLSLERVNHFAKVLGIYPEILLNLAIQDLLRREKLNFHVELRAA